MRAEERVVGGVEEDMKGNGKRAVGGVMDVEATHLEGEEVAERGGGGGGEPAWGSSLPAPLTGAGVTSS